jgi:hypothetical protein
LELTFHQRSFFFLRVWLGEFGGTIGRRVGTGGRGRIGERGGVGQDFVPVVEFVGEGKLLLHVGEGREHDLAEEGEGGGFAKGDTVLRDADEEFAEDVVDIGSGEEIAVEGGGDFGAEALGCEELQFLSGMKGAEGRMNRAAQHAATAAVGELKLAAWGDARAGILVRHGSLLGVDLFKAKYEIRKAKYETRNRKFEVRSSKYEIGTAFGEPKERSEMAIVRLRPGVR